MNPLESGLDELVEGKGHKSCQNLPRGCLKASWPFIYYIATAKQMVMCNDKNCT